MSASVEAYGDIYEFEPTAADVQWLNTQEGQSPNARPPEFITAKDFLALEFPDPEPLLGERSSRFLACGSLFIVYGDGGTGKSTWTIDGVAHLAAGRTWMDIPVHRPVSFLLIENEGHPGFLQETVRQKAETCPWGRDWLENVSFYSSPWGQFSYARETHRTALREHCEQRQTDVVVSNPLLGVGASGSGRPEETALFIDWLKQCGLWQELAFWLIHHENKAGQVSGDWNRHADTMAQLERNGQEESFKLTWTKPPRMGGLGEQPRIAILEWITATRGYTLHALDQTKVSDETLQQRIDDYLRDHPGTRKTTLIEKVEGNDNRIRALVNQGIQDNRIEVQKGPKKAQLCYLAGDTRPDPEAGYGQQAISHEIGSTERVIRLNPPDPDTGLLQDGDSVSGFWLPIRGEPDTEATYVQTYEKEDDDDIP